MSNRAFGVEIECYSPEGSDFDYDEGYGDGVYYSERILRREGLLSWERLVSEDESLHSGYGVEIKSPPLQGEEGFNELSSVMDLLRKENYWVDETCGMHVHINAPEFVDNPRLIKKVVKAWVRNQHIINNMVDDSRIDGHCCPAWTEEDVERLESSLDNGYGVSYSERGAINVGSLAYHETIEIRQHEGTLDSQAAISWIKFCQAFVDTVTESTVQKIGKEELLLKRLKVERNASRFLTTKARLKREAANRLSY